MILDLRTNKFKFIGGSLCLDFVNTVAGRSGNLDKEKTLDYQDRPRAEKIDDYADLLTWSVKAKLMTETEAKRRLQAAKQKPLAAGKVLRRARILRESLYRLFKSVVEGWKPAAEDLKKLNQELIIARQHQTLAWTKNGCVFHWIESEDTLDSMLWQIAESAAETLTAEDLTRLRQCGGDNCRWLFFDTSRNRSRQWCDMRDCGNLAKVRRFRRKQFSPSDSAES